MQSSKKYVQGSLAGALLAAALLAGCAAGSPAPAQASAPAPAATVPAEPAVETEAYEMQDGTWIELEKGAPLPEAVIADAHAALLQSKATVEAAGLPANGTGATPEQLVLVADADQLAITLAKRLSDATGRTAFVVAPTHGSVEGDVYGTVWVVVPWTRDHSVMASTSQAEVVANITAYAEQAGLDFFVVTP